MSTNSDDVASTPPKSAAEHDGSVVDEEQDAYQAVAGSTRKLCVVSWHVKMSPLEKHRNKLGLGNHLIMSLQKQTTKITIDLEQPTSVTLDPSRSGRIVQHESSLRDDESVLLRVWQRGETSASTSAQRDEKGWVEQSRYWLNAVRVDKVNGNGVKIQFGIGRELVGRQAKFSDEEDALKFQTMLQKMTELERDRGERQLEKWERSQNKVTSLEERERIKLLVEVVSISGIAKNVVPYVAIKMGGRVIHRTEYASSDTGNVIYTLTEGCFFLLDMTLLEFFCSADGMTFLVKGQDSIAFKGGIVGRAIVPLERILNAKGERDTYSLFPVGQQVEGTQQIDEDTLAKLCIRIRRATPDDIEFMSAYRVASDQEGVFSEETFLPLRPPVKTKRLQRKFVPHGETLYRVKPFPDPERPEETKWMTKDQIRQEAMKPSTHWVEAGSGTIGRVYIEIIGCDGLPNMDWANLSPRVSTDAFACLVFEDSVVNTDIISNTRNPRWAPWCRRAFTFNVSHPSSNILLGLFDWDPEKSPVQVAMSFASDVHDPIARIMVNVANKFSNSTYTATYPLYFAKSVEYRQTPRGTITLRIRKELYDERKAMLVGMKPPPMNYISVNSSNNFAVAHYTTEGDLNEEAYSLKIFTGYINELESYQTVLDYVRPAALSVLLWRGHYEVTILGKTMMLPFNSLLAFFWGILVTNNFNRFPAFLVFSIGWFMLACNEQARQNPNPWLKARRYTPLVKELVFGKTSPPDAIAPNEGVTAMAVYEKQLEEKAERLKREKETEAEYERTLREELGLDAVNQDDDEIVSTKQRILDKLSVNPMLLPFKSTLYPIQKELRKRVLQLRVATSIVTWQERIYAFWITTFSFVITALIFWVPWAFLLKWILRIAVWIIFGPWTAIVARYQFPEHEDMTDEAWEQEMRTKLQEKRREAVDTSTRIQIRKEDAMKRKALSRWMFGKFHLRSPRFTESLFPDVPLPCSWSEPYDPKTAPPIQLNERVHGQYLYGDMIPKREVQVDSSITHGGKASIFLEAGLGRYFDDAYGWAEFLNVSKVGYGMVGYGMAKGPVYAKKTRGKKANLVGFSVLKMASAGWTMGTTLASEIIFFENEDSYKQFTSGNFKIAGDAKVTVTTVTADVSAGTTGISLFDRFIPGIGKNDEKEGMYRNGVATFVIMKVGMMIDMSVVVRKFTFDAV